MNFECWNAELADGIADRGGPGGVAERLGTFFASVRGGRKRKLRPQRRRRWNRREHAREGAQPLGDRVGQQLARTSLQSDGHVSPPIAKCLVRRQTKSKTCTSTLNLTSAKRLIFINSYRKANRLAVMFCPTKVSSTFFIVFLLSHYAPSHVDVREKLCTPELRSCLVVFWEELEYVPCLRDRNILS